MSRVRVLHERRVNGIIIRLEDDPEKKDGYRLAVIREEEFITYAAAMDALRAAEQEAKKGRVILRQSD